MSFKYVNHTDLIVAGACVLTLLVFVGNASLDSVIPLYLQSLTVLGVFLYWSLRNDAAGMLRRGLVIGGTAGLFYTFVDTMFVDAGIITYLRRDIKIFATPVSVALVWMYCITIGIYCYLRLRSVFGRFYVPSAVTALCAFLSGAVFCHLGDRARLWVWNIGVPSSPAIGSTPLFVPVALFITFFLSPYIVGGQRILGRVRLGENPIAGGLRCAIMLALTTFLSFRILTG